MQGQHFTAKRHPTALAVLKRCTTRRDKHIHLHSSSLPLDNVEWAGVYCALHCNSQRTKHRSRLLPARRKNCVKGQLTQFFLRAGKSLECVGKRICHLLPKAREQNTATTGQDYCLPGTCNANDLVRNPNNPNNPKLCQGTVEFMFEYI